ncbi:MAG: hypothetical protein LUC21_04500 [Oscillospiraceae bacterium]|nr:hypothetical protein [Oscillospiraceae bacterium]
MDFTEWIENPSTHSTAHIFDPIPPQRFGSAVDKTSTTVDTGAQILQNGDVRFKIYAPSARTVEIRFPQLTAKQMYEAHHYDAAYLTKHAQPWMGLPEYTLTLEREDDFFTGILPYSHVTRSHRHFRVFIDGVHVLEPHMPVCFNGDCYENYVEIPDPDMKDILLQNIPHGSVTTDVYWSSVMNRLVRQLIYTPPDYRQSGSTYPVIYLHQGRSDTETGWVYSGKVPEIMDNLIAAGRAVPAIIVMNNGMLRTAADGTERYDGFLEMICKDTIPYVEANYRCKTDKWNRGLAGLSMGGMQACQGGLSHPELFSSLGLFSCSIRLRDIELDFEQNQHLAMLRGDLKRVEAAYRLIYRGNGIGEIARDPVIMEDDAWLAEHGVDQLSCYRRTVFSDNCGEHEWSTFRRCFHEYMQLAFR